MFKICVHVARLQECGDEASVDLLKGSFLHCPSPSSSVDTLTSRPAPCPAPCPAPWSEADTLTSQVDSDGQQVVARCEQVLVQVVATQVVLSRSSPGTQPSYAVTLTRHHHHHHQQEYCRSALGNTLHVKHSR